MEETSKPFEDNGQPDFLSLINAEVHKVEPIKDVVPPKAPMVPTMQEPVTPVISESSVIPIIQETSSTQESTPKREPHLKAETFAEPTLPIDGLSQQVQDYILTVTNAYGCPRDYVTAACLIIAGVAAGKKAKLENNPFVNYPNDYLCIVGKPSRNKTAPVQEVLRPLREHDKANFERYIKEKALYDSKRQEDKNYSGEKPVFHQLLAGDSSPESRYALLSQGDMILISADEIKSFIDSFGRYSKGGNGAGTEVSQMLSIWSYIDIQVNRKSEEPKYISDPAISIIGGIQPGPLARTFGTPTMMDSGFVQRFLFVMSDRGTFIKRSERKQITDEIRGLWRNIINRLLSMEPRVLHLSYEAKRIYYDYADNNDLRAYVEDDDYIGSFKQKMDVHAQRLAIMAHLLTDQWNEPIITGSTVKYAIRLVDYFTRIHLDSIYPLLTGNNPVVQKKLTKELVITEIGQMFDIQNKSALAEALNYDRAKLTNILNGKLKK